MWVTDRHDMTLAIKVALNPSTTTQPNVSKKLYNWLVIHILQGFLQRIYKLLEKQQEVLMTLLLLLPTCKVWLFADGMLEGEPAIPIRL